MGGETESIAGTFTNQGGLVFPANSQPLAYDADGNLTFDGVWTHQWDGENRLVAMWMTNGKHFKAAEINIHDYKVKIERRLHQGIYGNGERGGDWNADWAAFFDGKDPGDKSAQEIIDFGLTLIQKYGCSASTLK